jgi:hypothetical protein
LWPFKDDFDYICDKVEFYVTGIPINMNLMYFLELFRRLVAEDVAVGAVEDFEADGEVVVFQRRLVLVANCQFRLGVDLIPVKLGFMSLFKSQYLLLGKQMIDWLVVVKRSEKY